MRPVTTTWLQTYGDAAFDALNQQAIQIVTTHAAAATDDVRARMRAAFVTSARHELRFFAAPLEQGSPPATWTGA
ncbi:hypothetical protein [Micromonospora sp. WMMD812]|uniref:hypothetical protein n=1 Tax=Micromonospora sp. WMMD812 TaxID=3015152 RepID=UPI00248C8E64|nr:hypothetical protein [Micromonospora sp. WMMD812]WBB69076.1 hypothetical protein O7603_06915 [Micromonospora sp. WMMD812]